MLRASSCCLLLLVIVGCRITDREGFDPLPANGLPLTYTEILNRARGQSGAALDAFYIDAWLDLEQAAKRLEQSATLLPKATLIPDGFKTKLDTESDLLRQDAAKLAEAARTKNGAQANDAMQRINQRIRQLRPQISDDKK